MVPLWNNSLLCMVLCAPIANMCFSICAYMWLCLAIGNCYFIIGVFLLVRILIVVILSQCVIVLLMLIIILFILLLLCCTSICLIHCPTLPLFALPPHHIYTRHLSLIPLLSPLFAILFHKPLLTITHICISFYFAFFIVTHLPILILLLLFIIYLLISILIITISHLFLLSIHYFYIDLSLTDLSFVQHCLLFLHFLFLIPILFHIPNFIYFFFICPVNHCFYSDIRLCISIFY